MTARRLSPQQQRVLKLLEEAAAAGLRCPSNSEIADEADLMHHSDASSLVKQLESRGMIGVVRTATTRVVTIVATGRSTAPETTRPSARANLEQDNSYRGPVPEHLRVDRDPCPRCAVRRDIGCAHQPTRLGTCMGLAA